uniref:Uncharacterized protein n=1 Tax=Ciona savignyi TaxID=51511 RepID=H2YFU5_CIOSA
MTFDTVLKTSESDENVTSSDCVKANEPDESENMVDSPLTKGGANLLHVILKGAGGAVVKDHSSEDGATTTTNSQDTTGHGEGEKMGSNDVETTRAVGKARKVRQRRKQHSLQSSSSSISTIESTNTTNSLDKQLEYQKKELCKSRLRELILHHYLEQNYDDYFQQQQTYFEPSLNRSKTIKHSRSQTASVNSKDKAKLVVD